MNNIRNFAIIAHIDHGKSTVSDRLIQECGLFGNKEMDAQVLDSMSIEKERGITIKAQTVRLAYEYEGDKYYLNLMDTPGHVDFSYEVSRCLAACEGALLIIDATQGVEAQTLANAYKALDADLEIIPVFNKIDLPASDVEKYKKQVQEVIGIDASNAVCVSGKTGAGINDLLCEIIHLVPPPKVDTEKPLKIMLVDAWYDNYSGVVTLIRVLDGVVKKGDKVKMLSSGNIHVVEDLGVFNIKRVQKESLSAGEIGYLCANIKEVRSCKIGDTIVRHDDQTTLPLPGFKEVRPAVFCGLFPVDNSEYQELKIALEKLTLNDSSITYEYENSNTLGFGFRAGFLGLLHMEVTQERLEREFNLSIIVTAPNVVYEIYKKDGGKILLNNPDDMPDVMHIDCIKEPMADLNIVVPENYLGDVINLCVSKRGVQKQILFNTTGRVVLDYSMPMAEMILDFHDRLKSISSGYASFEWSLASYETSDIVKIGILINGDLVNAFSFMCHRSFAEKRGRALCLKLKGLITRQMFAVPLQAVIGAKIIARETIPAMRKDVTAKCYGGDVSRKRKLLDKQKKGKKKMKMLGSVEVPQSAFLAILKTDD